MRLWAALYAGIWVVLVEFLLAMIPFASGILIWAHAALGFAIVGVAYYGYSALRSTTAPGRIKRVASATFSLSIVMAFLGLLLLTNLGASWDLLYGITVWNMILFFHVLNAFAIITQMAAVAIAYDMWEEKEFLTSTPAGYVPPAPRPGKPAP